MKKLSRSRKIAIAILILLLLIVTMLAFWANDDGIERLPVTRQQQALADAAARAGAANVDANGRADGGMTIGGTIGGRQFAVAIPRRWNREALVFAHGYSLPGSDVAVSKDPVAKDPSGNLLTLAYNQGFAVGHSAYDKAGVGVEAGTKATLALKHFLDRMGAKRVYASGASMGGTITVTLLEEYPGEFAGGLAACGPGNWRAEIGALIDFRALYNYFTRGTEYALPGEPSVKVSALPLGMPWLFSGAQPIRTGIQMKRIAAPVEALFKAKLKNPNGPEAAIIRNVSSASEGEFGPEFASFAFPLLTVSLGQDDMAATMGGQVHDNRNKVYRSRYLTDAENAALNRGIERVAADAKAVAYATRWHETTGRTTARLVAIHNRVDSLVPFKRQLELVRAAGAAGNAQNLLALTVPTKIGPLPGTDLPGIAHCGFEPRQIDFAWNSLRRWVETGAKPIAPAMVH